MLLCFKKKPIGSKSIGKKRCFELLVPFLLAALAPLLLGSPADAEPSLLGIEIIDQPLPLYDGRGGNAVRLPRADDELPVLRAWLSKERNWAQDGHLDVIIELNEWTASSPGRIVLQLLDDSGRPVAVWPLTPPAPRFAVYPEIPPEWRTDNREGALQVVWQDATGQQLAKKTLPLRVEVFAEAADRRGRIPIYLPNENGVVAEGIPVTVGVPFPRGTLASVDNLRLVDSDGNEIALQVEATGHWSKYGSIRWVLCDFVVNFPGTAVELFLEYGEGVSRAEQPHPIQIETSLDRFPKIDAGRLLIEDGVWFDHNNDGQFVKVLNEEALNGAWVEHENGRLYTMADGSDVTIETIGAEKVVLRREGWYQEADGSGKFCQYITRYVIHRDSPLIRVFHTWIFTGSGNRDRIANMGWKLPLAGDIEPGGFLSAQGDGGQWLTGDYLLQYNFEGFELVSGDAVTDFPHGRAPGVARASGPEMRMLFGSRDFWQSFPSELEFRDQTLWFHNWPRHGKPQPEPLVDPDRATLLTFAHSGEALDFRLPEDYTEEPIDSLARGNEPSWLTSTPESVNAQGIARTEEFWLYFAAGPPADGGEQDRLLMAGLDSQYLRAVVDPKWVADSGVFYEIHPQDWDAYPRFEEQFENKVTLYRSQLAENAGLYGMWLHGEHLWSWRLGPRIYRQLRKGHGGYGVLSWMPYARSGDPRILQRRNASTRRIIDANFCHYASEDVDLLSSGVPRGAGPYPNIQRHKGGFWSRGPLPWAGRGLAYLDYETQPHAWWDAWYLTGYDRSREFALMWSERVKGAMSDPDASDYWDWVFSRGSRYNETILKAFIDSFQNTHDPWFIVWAHHVAELQREAFADDNWRAYGRLWSTGDREYHRHTGSAAHGDYYLEFVRQSGASKVGPLSYAWRISGDPLLLRQLAGLFEMFELTGEGVGAGGRVDSSSELPMVLAAFADNGGRPDAIHSRFHQRVRDYETTDDSSFLYRTPSIAIYKDAGEEVPIALDLLRLQTFNKPDDHHRYWLYGPDGSVALEGELKNVNTLDRQPGGEILIPAEAPEGVYRLHFEIRSKDPESMLTFNYHLRGLRLPVTPPGTAEVIELQEQRMGPAFSWTGGVGYYFYVPPDVTEFTVLDIAAPRSAFIINPDGAVEWQNDAGGTASATLSVAPNHSGQLWRIIGTDFTMDPQIPPFYSVDRDRWFLPETPESEGRKLGVSPAP